MKAGFKIRQQAPGRARIQLSSHSKTVFILPKSYAIDVYVYLENLREPTGKLSEPQRKLS